MQHPPSEADAVSILIPTYNRANLIERAIRSALDNCRPCDEIIVIDDGSTDATSHVVEAYGSRIRCLLGEHRGAGHARNIGIAAAKNPLIAFLDSDDAWMPFKLDLQRKIMAQVPDLAFCCSNFTVCLPNSQEKNYLPQWWSKPFRNDEMFGPGTPLASMLPAYASLDCSVHLGNFYRALMRESLICMITLLFRKSANPLLRFPEDLPTHEDWEFIGRLARSGRGAYLSCDTALNYAHSGPRLTNADDLLSANARLILLKRVWGSDAEFLESYRDEYLDAVSKQNQRAARWLISQGRGKEAAQYVDQVQNAPLWMRTASMAGLAKISSPLVVNAIALRARLRRFFQRP